MRRDEFMCVVFLVSPLSYDSAQSLMIGICNGPSFVLGPHNVILNPSAPAVPYRRTFTF